VYSFAMLVWELYTGRRLYDGTPASQARPAPARPGAGLPRAGPPAASCHTSRRAPRGERREALMHVLARPRPRGGRRAASASPGRGVRLHGRVRGPGVRRRMGRRAC